MASRKIYQPGVEQKRPSNVRQYDIIKCKKPIIRMGPDFALECDQPMILHRLIDTGLEIKRGDVVCNTDKAHAIPTRQMYVAVCKNKTRHLDGQIHVICDTCIENYDAASKNKTFEIVSNFWCYKRK